MALRSITLLSLSSLALASLAGCTSPGEVGEECADTADCAEDLSCFERLGASAQNVCMMDCDYTTQRLCADGSVCMEAIGPGRPAGLGFCYLGGTAAIGSPCTISRDCAQGAVCVDTGGALSCYAACSTDGAVACAEGEVCTALEDMGTRGFCEPAP